MKKIFSVILLLIVLLTFTCCGEGYVFGGNVSNLETENSYRFHYDTFKGEYRFDYTVEDTCQLSIIASTIAGDVSIYVYKGIEEVYSRSVNINTSGTTTVSLTEGSYTIIFNALYHSGSLDFIFGE